MMTIMLAVQQEFIDPIQIRYEAGCTSVHCIVLNILLLSGSDQYYFPLDAEAATYEELYSSGHHASKLSSGSLYRTTLILTLFLQYSGGDVFIAISPFTGRDV